MTTPEAPDMPLADHQIPLAAELALGVLDGDERAEALRRVLAEPAFAREVEIWRAHFALLFAQWPDAVAGADLEGRTLAALDRRGADVTPVAARQRNGWAWGAGAATLVAASLVLALALRPERIVTLPAPVAPVAAPLVATIAPSGAGTPFAAVFDRHRGEIRLAGAVAVPSGRSAELWSIGADGAPVPLGVFDGAGGARITVGGQTFRRVVAGVTLAVSIEPEGGSPTGLPTGPVVATGVLS